MKRILIFGVLSFVYMHVGAQDSARTDSSNKIIHLKEFVYSANKTEEQKSNLPYTIETITQKQIAFDNPETSADMLQNTGAVLVQKSQLGAGSPVLRGFEANKVLLVVDGMRMNNAIYRGGHLQDVITLDNSMLDHVEVIFGPSSVIYGSDALGGVMHFYTKKPVFGEDDKTLVKTNTLLRFSSANNEMTGHVDLNFGSKKFASLTSFTYSSFNDLRSGNSRDAIYANYWLRNYYVQYQGNGKDSMIKNTDPNIQKFSGYSQYDLLQKFAFRQNDKITHTLNVQYSNSSNVPRYDRLTDYSGPNLKFAEWYYGPQMRLMASLNTSVESSSKLFDKMNIILAYQNIEQDRISRKFNSKSKKFQMENVTVYSLNADLLKNINQKNDLRYGIELTFNNVQSTAHFTDIITNAETPADTRYPDGGSTMNTYAGYFSHRWMISDKLVLSDGIRFSASSLKSNFSGNSFFPFPFKSIEQKGNALTGNLGLVIKPGMGWKFSLIGSTGFRTPNVDDMAKVFDSSPGILIVPNPNLKPEQAYNGEAGIEKTFSDMARFSVVGWYTALTNVIVVKDFQYEGKDSVLYSGTMSRVQASQNADKGYITGVSGSFTADFNEYFSFRTNVTYTYGRYLDVKKDTLTPLDHIPPVFGQASLIFHCKNFMSEFCVRYNGWKELKDYSLSGEDNLNYATPYGMPAWTTLNFKTAYKVTRYLTINAGVENIMDTHYRVFASGISAPGRNLIVALRGSF